MSHATPDNGVLATLRQALRRRFHRPRQGDVGVLLLLAGLTLGLSVLALLLLVSVAEAAPLSAGDRLQVTVEAGEEFSGRYQLDVHGRIQLPYAGAVELAGQEPEVAAATISDRLVAAGLFRRSFVRTSVQVLAWAPLELRVSGAVYLPGLVEVNRPSAKDRVADRSDEIPGGSLPERKLSDALRAAGGVTPWADVAHVALRRKGQTRLYNLWGLVLGETGDDPAVQAGDEIIVPQGAVSQSALVRPSVITPPGIKVFISNLTQPSQSNAQATANGGMMAMAYGSRFSQAVVAANCVGGMTPTSGQRAAVLVRTDRMTGVTHTWDESVESLIRDSNEARNPMLLEGDAVACYDSGVTSVRDVFRTITDVLMPFSLIRNLR